MISDRVIFSMAFATLPRPVVEVWDTIRAVLQESGHLPKRLLLSQIAGHVEGDRSETDLVLTPEGVREVILERNLGGFKVCTSYSDHSLGFYLAAIQNTENPVRLDAELGPRAKAPDSWNAMIEALAVQWPPIGAWQWNNLYGGWQNTRNPSVYERRCGPIPPGVEWHETLDTLGRPLKQIRLQNAPGRRKSILPAIEVPLTAEMWLGPPFWQFAACTKAEVLAANFFLEKRDTPNFLYLKSWPEPFTRPDGEQGRIQQKLWKLLFHEDCEWPPGSGGISDEAIYGPPELMPKTQ